MKTTKLLGIKIFSGTSAQALNLVKAWLKAKTKTQHYIVTPNPEQLVQAQTDTKFKQILNQADLALPDGIGLIWAAKGQLKARISGLEFMESLCRLAGQKNYRVMLLGATKDRASQAAKTLSQRYGVEYIYGWQGAIDIRRMNKPGNRILVEGVNQFKPDILLVAYGAPWQEKWLYSNLKDLKIKVSMVVGGSFDQLVKPSLRPPQWLDKLGLGWFYRLLRQPWRIKRQLRLLKFGLLVLFR